MDKPDGSGGRLADLDNAPGPLVSASWESLDNR
jgi:hypothetical protein